MVALCRACSTTFPYLAGCDIDELSGLLVWSVLLNRLTFPVDSVEDFLCGFGPDERMPAAVPAINEGPEILLIKSRTEVKDPRRIAWRSVRPN